MLNNFKRRLILTVFFIAQKTFFKSSFILFYSIIHMVIKMDKIFTFVVNKENKLLLLRGSPNDPQFHKSFWYVVTGGREDFDKSLKDTVMREIKEETNLDTIKTKYLNWIFKYHSLGEICTEYVFITWVEERECNA